MFINFCRYTLLYLIQSWSVFKNWQIKVPLLQSFFRNNLTEWVLDSLNKIQFLLEFYKINKSFFVEFIHFTYWNPLCLSFHLELFCSFLQIHLEHFLLFFPLSCYLQCSSCPLYFTIFLDELLLTHGRALGAFPLYRVLDNLNYSLYSLGFTR